MERIGGVVTLKTDVQVIAATNRNLEDIIGHNLFRQDLYYRLNVFPIHVPALRDRRTDILLWPTPSSKSTRDASTSRSSGSRRRRSTC